MADMSTEFEGDYLSAKNYEEGERLVYTLKGISKAEFDDRDTGNKINKVVLHFNEKRPGMTCSKSNGQTLIQLYGKESDAWIGKRVAFLVTSSPVGMYFKLLDKAPKDAATAAAPL